MYFDLSDKPKLSAFIFTISRDFGDISKNEASDWGYSSKSDKPKHPEPEPRSRIFKNCDFSLYSSMIVSINVSESDLGSNVSSLSSNSFFQKFLLLIILETGFQFNLCCGSY